MSFSVTENQNGNNVAAESTYCLLYMYILGENLLSCEFL